MTFPDTKHLRDTLVRVMSGEHNWKDPENWDRVEEIARSLEGAQEEGLLHEWVRMWSHVPRHVRKAPPWGPIRELEAALKQHLGEEGRVQVVHSRYIVDAASGEILAERASPGKEPYRGMPRKVRGVWAVYIPPQPGGQPEPGDRVQVINRRGQASMRTVERTIERTPNGGYNITTIAKPQAPDEG